MNALYISTRLGFGLAVLALCNSFAGSIAFFQSVVGESDAVISVKGERGLTGTVVFDFSGKPLRSKTQRDSDAPLWMRLSVSPQDRHRYEAKFLGTVEGVYDLRSLMEHVDGSEVTEMAPIQVRIVSMLPKDHRSDLFDAAEFKPSFWGGYRLALVLVGLVWLSIPIFLAIRRSIRVVPPENIAFQEPLPSFADQLQPLIEAAASRRLSIREKGRLELLLLHYWRERSTFKSADMASAIRGLRAHPEAGMLVATVERWLHQSDVIGDEVDRSPEAIVELLKPYRSLATFDEPCTIDNRRNLTNPRSDAP